MVIVMYIMSLSVDISINGRVSDGDVIELSKFWRLYSEQSTPLFLSHTNEKFPFVFVIDFH